MRTNALLRISLPALVIAGFAACGRGPGTDTLPLPYRDASLPVERRVEDLLGRMTPEEKFRQLFMVAGDLDAGTDAWKDGIFGLQVRSVADARGAAEKLNVIQKFFIEETRLGIPIVPFEEALHGLVAPGATAFPQAIGLAATWDVELMGRVAGAVAAETRSRGIRQVLSPVINIARDARWGRVEETYGEDPLLASRMAVAFVRAFEERGVVATPKHFVANVGAGGRDSYPIADGERALREIDFPPFQAAIGEGGARSVMTAYNSWDGVPCSMNPRLLSGHPQGRVGLPGLRHLGRLLGRGGLQPAPDGRLLSRVGAPGLGKRPRRRLPDRDRARGAVRPGRHRRAGRGGARRRRRPPRPAGQDGAGPVRGSLCRPGRGGTPERPLRASGAGAAGREGFRRPAEERERSPAVKERRAVEDRRHRTGRGRSEARRVQRTGPPQGPAPRRDQGEGRRGGDRPLRRGLRPAGRRRRGARGRGRDRRSGPPGPRLGPGRHRGRDRGGRGPGPRRHPAPGTTGRDDPARGGDGDPDDRRPLRRERHRHVRMVRGRRRRPPGLVSGRGGRAGRRRCPVGGRRSRGAPAGHVPARRRPAAARLQPQADGAVRRLPRPPGRSALPVRIRAELHHVRVFGAGDRPGGDRRRRDGPRVVHGHERRAAGGRRGRRALSPRQAGLGRPAGHRAQGLPQGLPGAGRFGPGDVRPRARRSWPCSTRP